MGSWTWPFETEGPTLTNLIGPHVTRSGKVQRQRNRWVGDMSIKPKYPIYVLSKGRWGLNKTWRVLDAMGLPHRVVIEASEKDQYLSALRHYPHSEVVVLPEDFRERYGACEGGTPARNFIWEHSLLLGAKRHWVMDDNLHGFQRMHCGERQELWTGAGFKALEDFVDRYTNVAIAGPEYISFSKPKNTKFAYRLNTRVYSCILIKNDLPYRWEGVYNEDTHLCLRALKDGWCTVLSYAFLVDKTTTGRCTGGNTSTIYGETEEAWQKSREAMCDSLVAQHPDVVKKAWRFGRWQHVVDYSPFAKNSLIRVSDVPDVVSNYGLKPEHDLSK